MSSAFRDDRFPPIGKVELPTLSVGVSLLTDFEECDSVRDWTVGEHGVEMNLAVPLNWKAM